MSGRCKSCNKIMSDYEMTRKCVKSGDYLDICSDCYATIKDDVLTIDRPDLLGEDNTETSEYCFDEWSDD